MKKAILLIFSLLILSELSACSCAEPIATFCETISHLEDNSSPFFVINGFVSKKEDDGIEVTVQSVLLGDFTQEKFFIKSDSGSGCSHYTSIFSKDENYIFVTGESYLDAYWLSFCHISYLKIDDGMVKGAIAPGIESIPYDELGFLESCGTNLNLFSINNSLAVFPNPTLKNIRIKNISDYNTNTILQLEIIDAIGRDISFYKKEDGFLIEEEWIINISELAGGVYFLKIIDGGEQEVFKIVKQ